MTFHRLASRIESPAVRPPISAARWALAIGLVLVLITVIMASVGGGSPVRHAYVLPIIGAALRFGLGAAVVVAAAAALCYAPFVLPDVERAGFTDRAADGVASFAIFILVGVLVGIASARSRLDHRHYAAALAIQRTIVDGVRLEDMLERVRRILQPVLKMDEIGILVLEGPHRVAAGSLPIPVVHGVLATGVPRFVPDAGGLPRPRRQLVAPLVGGGDPVGVLAVERAGELGRTEQAGIVTLAAHLGLALENARLVSRQRRFSDELSEKIAAATRRLEEMDRAKSTFVATASHELRTPLTSLLGFGELLTTRSFGPDETRRLAGIVHRETERLVRIVDDLLDLSRLERGLAPTLRRTNVDVAPALLAAVDMFRRHQWSHHFEIDCDADVPTVNADADAFDRIVKNLVGNAVKYSPPGLVTVRAHPVEDRVEFQVEDHGRGIPADALPRLFDPYYRVPDSAGTARGTGLGLAIVKSLVEAQGGAIGVESVLG